VREGGVDLLTVSEGYKKLYLVSDFVENLGELLKGDRGCHNSELVTETGRLQEDWRKWGRK
jgi:hypothetical protein